MDSVKDFLKLHEIKLMLGAALAGVIWLYSQVAGVLPTVMQDEYVYSMEARHTPLADLAYPNYLFAAIYGQTSQCGIMFYSCTKTLDVLFFAGFAFVVFLFARLYLNRIFSFFIALATLIAPIGVYAGLFMPESMYFFFAALSLYLLARITATSSWQQLLLAGIVLGLTALVKPHAVFILIAAVLYFAIVHWFSDNRWKGLGISSGIYIAGFFVSKFGLGFALAGPSGLTIFGDNYTNSLNNFIENLFSQGEALSASGSETVLAAAESSPGLISTVLSQIGYQSAAMLILIPAGLIVFFAVMISNFKDRSIIEAPGLWLPMIVLLVMIPVVALFAALVTIGGDDHSQRLLLRYYEFLVPFIAITSIAAFQQFKIKSGALIATTAVIGLSAVLVAAAGFETLEDQVSDSGFASTVLKESWLAWLFVAVLVIAVVSAIVSAKTAMPALASAFVVVMTVGGVTAHASQNQINGDVVASDLAGIFVRDELNEIPGENIWVIGSNKQLTLASMFWMDKPDLKYATFQPGSTVAQSQIPAGVTHVVQFGGVDLEAETNREIRTANFTVSYLKSNELLFARDNFTDSITNVSSTDNAVVWIGETNTTITFDEPLPANASISLEIVVGAGNGGQEHTFSLGESSVSGTVPDQGQAVNIDLQFDNASAEQELSIDVPSASPKALGLIKITLNN